ncbi:MAG: acyltransferase [Rhizomicrobium sp.]|nr:acyltransferase [Rhizomicrobium sp.]
MIDPILRLAASDIPRWLTLPDLAADYETVAVTAENRAELATRYGLRVLSPGIGNSVMFHRAIDRPLAEPFVDFHGTGNVLIIGDQCALRGHVAFVGHENVAVVLGHQHALNLELTMYDRSVFFWGRGSSTYGGRIWTHGEKNVIVGDGCLFSEGITFLTSDHHAIVDLDTLQQLNEPNHITIQDHVWLGHKCMLLRGAAMGKGSILGAGSILSKSIPAAELWAGAPARMIRQNVSWVDSCPAEQQDLEKLSRLFSDRR